MGNTTSDQPISYTLVKKQKHQILGPYELVEAHFGNVSQLCVLRKRTHLDIQRINKDVTLMMGRENNSACKHVYKKVFAQQGRAQNYCSHFKQQEVFYECFDQDLEEQYFSKKGRNLTFEEEEILTILRHCLLALRLCEELNLKYYHISKKSILKSKSGAYMLIRTDDSQVSHPLEDYMLDFNSQLLVKNYCISPQLLLSLSEIVTNEQSNKDYIFSLGTTLLSLCLMKQLQFQSETVSFSFQNQQKRIYFNENTLKNEVFKLKKMVKQIKYSDKLKFLLENMIEFDENKRFSIQQLDAALGEVPIQKVKKIATRKLSFSTSKNSKENMKTSQTTKTIKMITPEYQNDSKHSNNIYLDALPILQNQKNMIANDAKNYKNAKIWKFKNEAKPYKEVFSRIISNEEILKDYTPIKHLNSLNIQSSTETKYIQTSDLPRAQSRYELVSDQTLKVPISKTSIAFNCSKSKTDILDNSKTLKYF